MQAANAALIILGLVALVLAVGVLILLAALLGRLRELETARLQHAGLLLRLQKVESQGAACRVDAAASAPMPAGDAELAAAVTAGLASLQAKGLSE